MEGSGAKAGAGRARGAPTRALVLLALTAFAGCDVYDRPNRPLPPGFKAVSLQGEVIDAEVLRGTPAVIVAWVPG